MKTALTPIRVEVWFWVILSLGLATGIGMETDWGRKTSWPVPEIATTPADFTSPALTEPFRLPPVNDFQNTTQRPLFVVTRRPAPPPPPPEPPKPTMQKGQFVLTGTTVVGATKFAFLLEKAGNRSRVVAEGKEINGILVKEVSAERVVLSQHDDMEVLVLKAAKPPPGPPAQAPARPTAGVPPWGRAP